MEGLGGVVAIGTWLAVRAPPIAVRSWTRLSDRRLQSLEGSRFGPGVSVPAYVGSSCWLRPCSFIVTVCRFSSRKHFFIIVHSLSAILAEDHQPIAFACSVWLQSFPPIMASSVAAVRYVETSGEQHHRAHLFQLDT